MDNEDLLSNARHHLAFIVCFQVFTAVIFCTRTVLLRNRTLRTTDKISNALYAIACASHIGDMSGLLYKCIREVQVRTQLRDLDRGGGGGGFTREELEGELVKLLISPYWTRAVFFIAFIYTIELWILKYAFVSFYWGLFRVQTRARWLLYGTLGVVTATFVAIVPTYLCWCLPIQRNWTSDLADYQKCAWNPSKAANSILASFNILTDLMIISLPLTILTSLRLKSPEKYALIFVFVIGIFSIAASVIRYSAVMRALSKGEYTILTLRELERWSIVEYSMGLLAFCLPALRGWVVKVFGSKKQKSSERNGEVLAEATIGSGPSGGAKASESAKKKDGSWEGYSNIGDTAWDGAGEEAICGMPRRSATGEDGREEWEMTATASRGGEIHNLKCLEPAERV